MYLDTCNTCKEQYDEQFLGPDNGQLICRYCYEEKNAPRHKCSTCGDSVTQVFSLNGKSNNCYDCHQSKR